MKLNQIWATDSFLLSSSPQPLPGHLLPAEEQDTPAADHRPGIRKRPPHPHSQTHPQVPPHICKRTPLWRAKRRGFINLPQSSAVGLYILYVLFQPQGSKIPKPWFLQRQILQVAIGTFRQIATVKESATVYDALSIFVERRVSALPVVNEQGSR